MKFRLAMSGVVRSGGRSRGLELWLSKRQVGGPVRRAAQLEMTRQRSRIQICLAGCSLYTALRLANLVSVRQSRGNISRLGYDAFVRVLFLLPQVPVLGICQGLVGETKLMPKLDAAVQRVEAPGLFRGLGMISDEQFQARVRGSRDGLQWGDWQEVELGHEGGSLVWFGEAVRFVEVPAQQPLRLLFIEPGTQKPVWI